MSFLNSNVEAADRDTIREVDIAYLIYESGRLSKDEQERARILRIEAEQRRLKKAEEENKEVVTINVTEVSRQELMSYLVL